MTRPTLPVQEVAPSASSAEVARLAATLAEALYDNSGFSWCAPNDKLRTRYGDRYMAALVEIYLQNGRVWCLGDADCVFLWSPAGTWRAATFTQQMRLLPVTVAATRRHLVRTVRGMAAMESVHQRMPEPHCYFALMGTRPAMRGKGYGSVLLSALVDTCDDERQPAYAEATSPRVRALCERLGFHVVHEQQWPGGGPQWWGMWRDPR